MKMSYAKARLRLSRLETEISILKQYSASYPSLGTAMEAAKQEWVELQKLTQDAADDDVRLLLRTYAYSDDRDKARIAEYVAKLHDQTAACVEKNAAASARIVGLEARVKLLEKALDIADEEFSTNFSGAPAQWSWLDDAQSALAAEDSGQEPAE